jgi:predicted nuclease of predicted toxin-antitoxin system
VRFLVDAHLPPKLCDVLASVGHDATHTRSLPRGNATPDPDLTRIADSEERVLMSKDSDFFYSHLLLGTPRKLLLVRTGNLSTSSLVRLVEGHLEAIVTALETHSLIELHPSGPRSPC